jgi:hypothetical protein
MLILYGVLDVGTAPGVSSIEKSISLLGGTPGTSFGHMYLYSLNMGWSSRFGLSSSTESDTCMTYKEYPFMQYFFSVEGLIFASLRQAFESLRGLSFSLLHSHILKFYDNSSI